VDSLALPLNVDNNAIIIANDFDRDGDARFICGKQKRSKHIWRYSQELSARLTMGTGKFTDIAATMNPAIANIVLVTGAAWADVTGDGREDLIIAGEWMYPHIFSYTGDHFNEVKTNLSDLYGWWQAIAVCDINGDGKQDLILGNIGDNFYLQPDAMHPVKLWINDFDKNGIADKILTRTVDGKDVPVYLKRELTGSASHA
jgi:hypothetical protein